MTDSYLTSRYVAPGGAVSPSGAAGRLVVPALRISAPIDVTRIVNGVMAIPNNVDQVGWLSETAARTDLAGASVVAGHVSDDADTPGALWNLRHARLGQVIEWYGPHGDATAFVITAIHSYPRTQGLPPSAFTTAGPHALNLVTCADKVTSPDGSFHYTDNLVVTATVSRT